MLDTLITGGRVVTPAGTGDWDVGIAGEKIAVVARRTCCEPAHQARLSTSPGTRRVGPRHDEIRRRRHVI